MAAFFGSSRNPDERDQPKRLYARVDQFEEPLPGEESRTTQLDCIDADAFEATWREHVLTEIMDEDPDWDISVVMTEKPSIFQMAKTEDVEWLELLLGPPTAEGDARHSTTLFGDPVDRFIEKADPVDPVTDDALKKTMGWDGIEPSDRRSLEEVVAAIPRIDGAAIYDVGQGTAVGLLNGKDTVAYFDLGGSVLVNARSFPDVAARFCFANNPPIFLSHWDWDHWSSAMRDPAALARTWVLPIQSRAGSLGAVHARFVAALRRNKARLLWLDHEAQAIAAGGADWQLLIERSRGDDRSRNESGLMGLVGFRNRQLLLPGDGSLPFMPFRNPQNENELLWSCDYIAVPHHGGRTDMSRLPAPARVTRSTLVYSYGAGNSFLHPLDETVRQWRASPWRRNAHTTLRQADGLGHVGIDLDRSRQGRNRTSAGLTHDWRTQLRALFRRIDSTLARRPTHCSAAVRRWLS